MNQLYSFSEEMLRKVITKHLNLAVKELLSNAEKVDSKEEEEPQETNDFDPKETVIAAVKSSKGTKYYNADTGRAVAKNVANLKKYEFYTIDKKKHFLVAGKKGSAELKSILKALGASGAKPDSSKEEEKKKSKKDETEDEQEGSSSTEDDEEEEGTDSEPKKKPKKEDVKAKKPSKKDDAKETTKKTKEKNEESKEKKPAKKDEKTKTKSKDSEKSSSKKDEVKKTKKDEVKKTKKDEVKKTKKDPEPSSSDDDEEDNSRKSTTSSSSSSSSDSESKSTKTKTTILQNKYGLWYDSAGLVRSTIERAYVIGKLPADKKPTEVSLASPITEIELKKMCKEHNLKDLKYRKKEDMDPKDKKLVNFPDSKASSSASSKTQNSEKDENDDDGALEDCIRELEDTDTEEDAKEQKDDLKKKVTKANFEAVYKAINKDKISDLKHDEISKKTSLSKSLVSYIVKNMKDLTTMYGVPSTATKTLKPNVNSI